MTVILARALASPRSGQFQSCGTEIGLARAGYARASSFASSLGNEAAVLRPLGLGSRGGGGAMTPPLIGRVAGWVTGDLSPKDWNWPGSRTAKAVVTWGRI